MEKLNTIQKRERLNDISALGNRGNGNAHHTYLIKSAIPDIERDGVVFLEIQFQDGARKELGSTHGVLDSDLLEIVRHRLSGFQAGDFANRETAIALTHIEEALLWLNKRVEDRIDRGVLGTNNK